MSWNYSGDPAVSDLDAVRYYVQDTDESDQLVSDEEIAFMLSQWSGVNDSTIYVASMIAENIAGKFAREVAYSADGVSVGTSELQDKYRQLAVSLRDQYARMTVGAGPYVGGVLWNEEPDPQIKPTIFALGMNDNIAAGQQNFGSETPVDVPEVQGF